MTSLASDGRESKMHAAIRTTLLNATSLYQTNTPPSHDADGSIEADRVRNQLRIRWQKSKDTIQSLDSPSLPIQEAEYEHIINTISMAVLNPRERIQRLPRQFAHHLRAAGRIEWDVDRFLDKVKNRRVTADTPHTLRMENDLRKFFPEAGQVRLSEPAVIVDMHSNILVWYLPGILAHLRIDEVNCAVASSSAMLQESRKQGENNTSWRTDPTLFQTITDLSGCYNMSPCWFNQAHDVRHHTFLPGSPLTLSIQRLADDPHPSKTMNSPEAPAFFHHLHTAEQLLNTIVAVIAPEQYHVGLLATEAVKRSFSDPMVQQWPSVFTGITVIVQRETPPHRDEGGAVGHSDLLLSAGKHTGAELMLPDVATALDYDPETVVLLAGRALLHSVPKGWDGTRICLAHYMKDKVHERLGVPRPPLANLKHYNKMKADGYLSRVKNC